jgi:hypothetical protein
VPLRTSCRFSTRSCHAFADAVALCADCSLLLWLRRRHLIMLAWLLTCRRQRLPCASGWTQQLKKTTCCCMRVWRPAQAGGWPSDFKLQLVLHVTTAIASAEVPLTAGEA